MSAAIARAIASKVAAIEECQKWRPETNADAEDFEKWGKEFVALLVSLLMHKSTTEWF
jgi:hypothetical protein